MQDGSLNPGWEMAVVMSKINLFYFTGTMQDGMLIIHGKKCNLLGEEEL